ncbi:MAG: inositol monophosphatase family protein [Gammaproteobacteria bacterium]|nr:inositol monophosphatase family protein [Gammaproteobacteria bacterium]
MHPLVNIAVRAARQAGAIIVRNLGRISASDAARKGHNDFVSEVDRQAEAAVIQTIQKAYPHHSILAEESGAQGDSEYQWVIDPLDGTTNFLHGFPVFSVSIAVSYRGRLQHAVVYDPLRQEIFSASQGSGAQMNDRRIRVSRCRSLGDALLGTGFPFRDLENLRVYLRIFQDLLTRTSGIRRAGSAAIDLAYVACGRLDGFWEFGLKPWDMAAGALLIREAGGFVGDFQGTDHFLDSGNIVAGTDHVYRALQRTVGAHVATPAQA